MNKDVDLTKLKKLERDIYKHIRCRGYESVTCLRIRFKLNRIILNYYLQSLFKLGLISRDIQGMVISTEWLEENPEKREWIEQSFQRIIV